MGKIRVCAYCRVSTNSKDQANSYENQKDYFEKELSKNPDYELINVYADKGLSGTKLSRPQFDKMLNDAGLDIMEVKNNDKDNRKEKIKYVTVPSTSRSPKFNKIFVTNTSRFARNVLVEEILRDLRKSGVYVHFLDLGKTTENEDDITYIQIFQSFDERESRDKSKKVSFGISQGIDKGVIHSSSKLYGYRYIKDENRLEVIPEEAKVVKKIFDLYSQNFGIRKIIDYLTKNNIFTRQEKPFVQSTIRRILNNEKYIGLNNRGKYYTGKVFEKNSYPKVKDEYITTETDKIPAIIEKELFYKCRDILYNKINHTNQKGLYKGISEYAGKILCGKCNSVYHSNANHKHHFFNCGLKKKKGKSACDNVNVSLDEIESLISDFCNGEYKKRIETSINGFNTVCDIFIQNKMRSINKNNEAEIENKKSELEHLEKNSEKVLDLYLEGKISKELYEKKYNSIQQEIQTLNKEISELSKSNDDIYRDIKIFEKYKNLTKEITIKDTYTRDEILDQITSITIKDSKLDFKKKKFYKTKEILFGFKIESKLYELIYQAEDELYNMGIVS